MVTALVAVALAMCLRDVAGYMATIMANHNRSTLAAVLDVICDVGVYLVPALGIEQAGGVSLPAILAVMAGGFVGTKMGVAFGTLLERRLEA